jgi:hypothetical protein
MSSIDPRHGEVRSVLRIVGPLVLASGLLLIGIGVASLFDSMHSFGPPKYFWCAFLGVPVLFLGLVMTIPAFMGSVTRYVSAEVAPVHKDTFNYLAHGTSGGVRTLATALREGLATGVNQAEAGRYVACPSCQVPNLANAQFCHQCGASLGVKICAHCAMKSDANAKFCHQCGTSLIT